MNCIISTRFSPRPPRLSKDKTTTEYESCEVQEAACRAKAQELGWTVRAVYHDRHVSGAAGVKAVLNNREAELQEDRPGLFAALDDVRKGETLLLYSPDRLARSVIFSEIIRERLRRRGVQLAFVHGQQGEADTAEGELIRIVLAAISQYQRRLISARTSAVLQRMQAAGRRVSRIPPFGFRLEGSALVPAEDEQRAIEFILEWARQGLGARRIKARLEAELITVRRGPWVLSTIQHVVRRHMSRPI